MKPWKIALLLVLAVVIAVGAYGYVLIRRGFGANENPSWIEATLANAARSLSLRVAYRNLRNPVPATPENIAAGMAHYADHCAICHGNDGSGDTLFGRGLYPRPPDLRSSDTQNDSDGEIYATIENGVRNTGMPAFGKPGNTGDMETWHLVLFIRHLPNLTPEELQQMEALNPKTEEERDEEKQEQDFLNGGSAEPPGNSVPAQSK